MQAKQCFHSLKAKQDTKQKQSNNKRNIAKNKANIKQKSRNKKHDNRNKNNTKEMLGKFVSKKQPNINKGKGIRKTGNQKGNNVFQRKEKDGILKREDTRNSNEKTE